jgi:long-chain acyl-CoA synthetase
LKYERFFHPLRFLNLLPLSHVFGQFLGIFVPPLLGATVVFQPSLKPAEVVHAIHRERVSVLVAVPRVLEALRGKIERDFAAEGGAERFRRNLEAAENERFLKRWWRFGQIHRQFGWKFWAVISGGAALPLETETFWTRLGYAVIQGYGLTETTSLVSVNHPFRLGKGSIGKALPGREIKLDASGEILVRGESVASGYWEGAAAKPAPGAGKDSDGWFRTGDLGTVDSEGNLYFKGRKKNVIVTPAGMNVYPEDLEAALRRQPEVRDAVVVGLERDGNAEPCAALLLNEPEADPEPIVKRANATLAEYQRMHHWFVWPEQDFPRTSTGKPRAGVIAEVVHGQIRVPEGARATGGELANLIARVTGRAPSGLRPDADLAADLNLSSLDRVELLSAIEDRYQIELNETSFATATTFGELERLLRQTSARRSEYVYPRWTQRWPVTWVRPAIYYLLAWPATLLLGYPRVAGRANLRNTRAPVLVVCNHITFLDAALILAALPARLRHRLAVAMEGERLQLMRRPPAEWNLFRRALYRIGYALAVALFNVFPLPQQSGFRESFQFGGESVDRGYSLLVFPEGARTKDGRIAPFQAGIGLLATNLRIPIVPMRIDGLFELKRAGKRIARPGQICVTIGAPVEFPADADPQQIARELESRVARL